VPTGTWAAFFDGLGSFQIRVGPWYGGGFAAVVLGWKYLDALKARWGAKKS